MRSKIFGLERKFLKRITCNLTYANAVRLEICPGAEERWRELGVTHLQITESIVSLFRVFYPEVWVLNVIDDFLPELQETVIYRRLQHFELNPSTKELTLILKALVVHLSKEYGSEI